MTIIEERLDLLDGITLKTGAHQAPPNDADTCDGCIMEIVAWISGEPPPGPEALRPSPGRFRRHPGAGRRPRVDGTRLARPHPHARVAAPRRSHRPGRPVGWSPGVPVRDGCGPVEADVAGGASGRGRRWGGSGAAARAAAGDAAGDAARAAARDALRPTVVDLQASAHALVGRMLAVTETDNT
jgi:hypothetical protein